VQLATLRVAADPSNSAGDAGAALRAAADSPSGAGLAPSCAERVASGEIRPRVERVLVEKSARRLSLWFAGFAVREYRVALGREPVGDKRFARDGRTPEGVYTIDARNPGSEFYRSLHISYPNAADLRSAREAGRDPGGEIMIHGLPNDADWVGGNHTRFDWTEGCIAVTNEEIDEIWELVADGTPIEIRP
jgi:murein L,D-transpeptidase YafK